MFAQVKQVFIDVTQIEEASLTMDARLKDDLKYDSLTVLELVLELESAFEIEIDPTEVSKLKTFGDVVAMVQAKKSA
jgi:acyl carrier protein